MSVTKYNSKLYKEVQEGLSHRMCVSSLYFMPDVYNDNTYSKAYHNLEHFEHMYEEYKSYLDHNNMPYSIMTHLAPFIAIMWHDAVYNPTNSNNEHQSWYRLNKRFQLYKNPGINTILPFCEYLIWLTKNHKKTSDMPEWLRAFIESDMAILGTDLDTYQKYAKAIRKEYSHVSNEHYVEGRTHVLQSFQNDWKFDALPDSAQRNKNLARNIEWELAMLQDDPNFVHQGKTKNIKSTLQTIEYPENWNLTSDQICIFNTIAQKYQKSLDDAALYAGSFDPVTKGHMNIVNKALNIFPMVYILVADNRNKKYAHSASARQAMLELIYWNNMKVVVGETSSFVAFKAKNLGITTLIRGLRPIGDFETETQLAMANKELNPDLETVFVLCDVQDSYISSSTVKELFKAGKEYVEDKVHPVVLAYMDRSI